MRDADSLLLLKSELAQDLSFVLLSFEENRKMTARQELDRGDEMAVIAVAYTLHNLYMAMEAYFLRLAKAFENRLRQKSWHEELLSRMTLSIEGIRPALLDVESREDFDELRKFRHAFRNIYKSKLRPEKVAAVNKLAPKTVKALEAAHGGFTSFLDGLIREVGG